MEGKMMKEHLRRKIAGARGGPHYLQVLAKVINEMTEQEAEALFRILQHVEEDATMQEKSRIRRRMGGFVP